MTRLSRLALVQQSCHPSQTCCGGWGCDSHSPPGGWSSHLVTELVEKSFYVSRDGAHQGLILTRGSETDQLSTAKTPTCRPNPDIRFQLSCKPSWILRVLRCLTLPPLVPTSPFLLDFGPFTVPVGWALHLYLYHIYIYIYIHMYIHTYIYIYTTSTYLPTYLPTYLSIYLSIYLSTYGYLCTLC